ncbi:MAG: hypothetical protein QXH10_09270 [Ignisphaera sp.]
MEDEDMSLSMLIKNLIAPITDPATRIDIATTINYLFSVYLEGADSEDRIRAGLYEVCETVLRATHTDLTEAELKDAVEKIVNDFMKAFKLEALRHRVLSGIKTRYGLP